MSETTLVVILIIMWTFSCLAMGYHIAKFRYKKDAVYTEGEKDGK